MKNLRSTVTLGTIAVLAVLATIHMIATPTRAEEPKTDGAAPAKSVPLLLTKHENETFTNQTVYISGQAFINCKFVACTLVIRESMYHMQNNSFERCNWHVDWLVGWGDPASVKELASLVKLLEQAQTEVERKNP